MKKKRVNKDVNKPTENVNKTEPNVNTDVNKSVNVNKPNVNTPVVLSDGQVWYPNPQPDTFKQDNINYMGKLRNDLKERQATADRYPRGLNLAEKLVNPGWTSFIKFILENLNPSYHESLRIGMSGPSLADLAPLMAKR